jgi:hypothetical protein
MQFDAVDILSLTEAMTIQADTVRYFTSLFDFTFMARILAAGSVRNKLAVVNLDKAPLDDLVGNLMTAFAACLN